MSIYLALNFNSFLMNFDNFLFVALFSPDIRLRSDSAAAPRAAVESERVVWFRFRT